MSHAEKSLRVALLPHDVSARCRAPGCGRPGRRRRRHWRHNCRSPCWKVRSYITLNLHFAGSAQEFGRGLYEASRKVWINVGSGRRRQLDCRSRLYLVHSQRFSRVPLEIEPGLITLLRRRDSGQRRSQAPRRHRLPTSFRLRNHAWPGAGRVAAVHSRIRIACSLLQPCASVLLQGAHFSACPSLRCKSVVRHLSSG